MLIQEIYHTCARSAITYLTYFTGFFAREFKLQYKICILEYGKATKVYTGYVMEGGPTLLRYGI